jgi:hypothetical protein
MSLRRHFINKSVPMLPGPIIAALNFLVIVISFLRRVTPTLMC